MTRVLSPASFAANLYGLCEEEHAGGAVAFPTYIIGEDFDARSFVASGARYEAALALLGDRVESRPGRYAVDRSYPDIFYVPEDAQFSLRQGVVRWTHAGASEQLVLRAGAVYVLPDGYKVRLEKQVDGSLWRLVGARPDGVLCHKPCTGGSDGTIDLERLTTVVRAQLARVGAPAYLEELTGTIGADPFHLQMA